MKALGVQRKCFTMKTQIFDKNCSRLEITPFKRLGKVLLIFIFGQIHTSQNLKGNNDRIYSASRWQTLDELNKVGISLQIKTRFRGNN